MKWKCPMCGREFSSTEQPHDCGKPETVQDYILSQDVGIRPGLEAVRAVIRSILPDAEERISWSMPTYWKVSNLIHFAASKKHLGIYPGPEAVEAFTAALDERGMKHSKGAIQMPYDRIDLSLVREVAAFAGRSVGANLDWLGYCGVDCASCTDYTAGTCPGCRKSEWRDDPCPPVGCCRKRDIPYCGACHDFPCQMMQEFYEESDSHGAARARMQRFKSLAT